MMWKSKGRAALLICASLVLGLGLTSCGTSSLGYIYITSVQYGQIFSFRIDANSGAIKGSNCSVTNSQQQKCSNGSGGTNPTKLALSDGNTNLYVLNLGGASTSGGTNSLPNIALVTLGSSGSVYTTGQTYASSGQNAIDMYLSGAGFLYVLDQYQPATSTLGSCVNPTPTTCPGDITVFSIGSNGNLVVVLNAQMNDPQGNPLPYFPIGYVPTPPTAAPTSNFGGNHFFSASGTLFILDNNLQTQAPQVDPYEVNASNGQLTAGTTGPTIINGGVTPFAINGGGSVVFVSDIGTGAIFTYTLGSNGALAQAGNGYFCPANPSYVYTNGGLPVQATCAAPTTSGPFAVYDALLINSVGSNTYLYAADWANSKVYSMVIATSTTGGVLSLANGGPNPVSLGTSPTCLTVSSGTPFLYAAGNGSVAGEQIDTSTGVLTTQNYPLTSVSVQGYDPCIMFSSRI